jgi:hypothetical protein
MSLKPHQENHARALLAAWEAYGVYLDASDTGAGKSYIAAHICRVAGVRPVIICPLGAIPQWFAVMAAFGVEPIAVSNFEQIKYSRAKVTAGGPMTAAGWLHNTNGQAYRWELPENSAIIFDECHRGKNAHTGVSELLVSLRSAVLAHVRVALLSATAADTLEAFRPIGAVLGITQKDATAYKNWAKRRENPLGDIARELYESTPPRASKLTLAMLQQQQVEMHTLDLPPEATARADELTRALEAAAVGSLLGDIQKCRREIEILKAPFVAELAHRAYIDGYRPVIFTNFDTAREIIYSQLVEKIYKVSGRPPVQLHGRMHAAEREQAIRMFCDNSAPAIVVSIAVGGTAISLHSTEPGAPRALFIMPGWSGIDITQALGRCAREGAADVPRAWIIYTNVPLERHICELMNDKLRAIAQLNKN